MREFEVILCGWFCILWAKTHVRCVRLCVSVCGCLFVEFCVILLVCVSKRVTLSVLSVIVRMCVTDWLSLISVVLVYFYSNRNSICLQASLERIYQEGLWTLQLGSVLFDLAFPVLGALGLVISAPYVVAHSFIPWLGMAYGKNLYLFLLMGSGICDAEGWEGGQ